jgi:predicted MFS family arabinose efflux permease
MTDPGRQTRLILLGAAVMLCLSMGMRQSLSLFLPPVTRDLGITAADFTFAIAVQNVVWGLSQAPIGMLADRWGLRWAMVGGTLVYAASLVVMILADGAVALMVSGALMGVALSCTASALCMTACARAVPEERRSTALGLVAATSSLGTAIVAPILQVALDGYDWRLAMLFFLALAAIMVPAAWSAGGADRLPRPARAEVPMRAVLRQAARHRGFLVMTSAYFVCGLQLVFLTTHLPNYLDICGMDPMLGAQALAIIGVVNILGSYSAGWLGQRYPKHILLGSLYVLRSVTLTLYFLTPPTPTSTIVFAAVMGMLWLGVMPLTSGLVAEMFGTRYMATLLGIAFITHQGGSFLGAWGGGVIVDAMGSYDQAWRIGVAIGLIAGVAQITLGGPVRPTGRRLAPAMG